MANEAIDPWRALEESINAFPRIPDKEQAWNDLHRLSKEENSGVRWSSAYVIGAIFSNISEKQQAWEDLMRLVKDEDIGVQYSAAEALINAFPYTPDKQKAWNDLHLLAKDRFLLIILKIFIKIFINIPDQQQVWEDLFRLAKDKNFKGRWNVAYALGEVLTYIPDKQQVWEDLVREIKDEVIDPHLKRSMIDQMLKKKIKEIQEIAKKVSIESKGTPKEGIAVVANQIVQLWEISDQAEMTRNVKDLIRFFKLKIPNHQANKDIYDKIENIIKEKDIVRQYQQVIDLIISIPTKVEIAGDLIMGDVFKNIKNATIINKAVVMDSFNKVKREHDEEVAKALLQIGEFIEKSGNKPAGILFDEFNKEINKPQSEKSTLKKIWDGIEQTLPAIATISKIIAKIAPLF